MTRRIVADENDNLPRCELCGRQVYGVTRHHLTPLQKGGKGTPTVNLCQPCHVSLHHFFTNAELAKEYNTIEKLQASPRLQEYLEWIRTRQIEKISYGKKKR